MMSFGQRKLLLSQIDLRNTRVLLENETATCVCYLLCPPECNNRSENDHLPPTSPLSTKKNDMPTLLILMLCILGAAFVFLCYLTILKRYRLNLSNSMRRISLPDDGREFFDENHGTVIHPIWYIQTVGLQQSVIDSIPVFKYKKGEGLIEGTDCSVCLSDFEEDESLRLLPKCSHAFHISCIDTWLRSHKNCPLCRAPIVRDPNVSTGTTQVSTLQSVLENSDSREDTSVDDQPENYEVGEAGVSELRIGVENIGQLPNEEGKILEMAKRNSNHHFIAGNNRIRVLSDLADHRVRVREELQPAKRSFSMDISSVSIVYPAKDEGCSNIQDLGVKKQNFDIAAAKKGNKSSSIHRSRKSFSFGRSLQSMPIRMKRSFSSSGMFSLHSHSRSQELVQTQRQCELLRASSNSTVLEPNFDRATLTHRSEPLRSS